MYIEACNPSICLSMWYIFVCTVHVYVLFVLCVCIHFYASCLFYVLVCCAVTFMYTMSIYRRIQ